MTVISQVALRLVPSVVVAVIVAVPRPFAVTKPLPLTVATLVLLEVHVTAGLVALPGVTVAVNWTVSPLFSVAVVLFNVMPVTNRGFTVTWQVALLLLPSAVVTVIVALPTDFAVTRPVLLTVTTAVLLDDHVTVLSVVLSGDTVAVSCNVFSISMLAVVWLNVTPVANCGVTVT